MLPDSIFGLEVKDEGTEGFGGIPMRYRGAYEGRLLRIGDALCVLVTPKGQLRPLQAQKLCRSIRLRESLPSLVHAEGATAYQRRSMTARGVAWISSENTFSIPFLAVSCDAREVRKRPAGPLSANAQRVAVGAIEGQLIGMTTSEVAKILGVSLSSAVNYFSELEADRPGLVGSHGRTRLLQIPEGMTKEGLYNALRPYMSSPVRSSVFLKVAKSDRDAVERLPLSGMSALSLLTEIPDDPWQTRALFGSSIEETFPNSTVVGEYDLPDVLIELWRYKPWEKDGAVDAISLLANLEEWDEMDDEELDEAVSALRRLALS